MNYRREGWRRIYIVGSTIWAVALICVALWAMIEGDEDVAATFAAWSVIPPSVIYVLLFHGRSIIRWVEDGFKQR